MTRRKAGFRITLIMIAMRIFFPQSGECEGGGLSVVPMPAEWTLLDGEFPLTSATPIVRPEGNIEAAEIAAMCAKKVHEILGFSVRVASPDARVRSSKPVCFELDPGIQAGGEAYTLAVTRDSVRIRASDEAGLFYGMQTFLQLLPADDSRSRDGQNAIGASLPCVRIQDTPRFRWRGMHLDVSRHFFPKEDVKKAIDLLAIHKMNVFHWHLTDDQGWRIEIADFPLLTQKGAWREGTGQEPWDYFVGPDGRGLFHPASVRFGLEFTGFIRAPREGVYTFFTSSDDGSRLYIGEVLLADNDGVHGGRSIQGSIALAAGRHPIRVLYFENKFGEMLKVGYEGPGIGRREIPDSVLTH
jgi:hypothetical protein